MNINKLKPKIRNCPICNKKLNAFPSVTLWLDGQDFNGKKTWKSRQPNMIKMCDDKHFSMIDRTVVITVGEFSFSFKYSNALDLVASYTDLMPPNINVAEAEDALDIGNIKTFKELVNKLEVYTAFE